MCNSFCSYKLAVVLPSTSPHENNTRRTKYAGYCRRSMDELITEVFLLTHNIDVKTHMHQLGMDHGFRLKNTKGVMDESLG